MTTAVMIVSHVSRIAERIDYKKSSYTSEELSWL